MAKIECHVEEGAMENDEGFEVEGTTMTCRRCGHVTTSAGTSDGSRKRCLWLMRQECPQGEKNFYVDENE